jgi:hypothetical protein
MIKQGMVVLAYNPSYLEGKGWRTKSSSQLRRTGTEILSQK